jgi:hypothetical protein
LKIKAFPYGGICVVKIFDCGTFESAGVFLLTGGMSGKFAATFFLFFYFFQIMRESRHSKPSKAVFS